MKERKAKTLVYKQAKFHKTGPNLKKVLQQALQSKDTVGARRESLSPPDESPIWRLIGQHKADSDFLFGVLMRYMPGMNPAFVVDDSSAKTLALEQLSAPVSQDGNRRELLDGMLFFGVIDNHLVLMQSTSLRSEHLEKHFQWLMHQAATVPGDNTLQLVDQPPEAVRKRVSASGVRELDIGGALTPIHNTYQTDGNASTGPESVATKIQSVTISQSTASDGIWATLKSMLSPDKAAQLDIDALTGSNIEYTLRIRYKNTTSDQGHEVMNTLGSALRHAEGVETKIHLIGGGEVHGDELKMTGCVRIDTYDGIPNADEVFEEMRLWLLGKLKSGEMQA